MKMISSSFKKLASGRSIFKLLEKAGWIAACSVLTAASYAAAPDATAVNTESEGIAQFIITLLNGWPGYLLAIIAFCFGIFEFFSKNGDRMKMFGSFAIAIAIIVVPPALEGFFSGI